MKTWVIFLLLFLGQGLLLGQQNRLLNREVNVSFSNTSIEEILKSLETEDLSFVYSPEVFDVKKRVSINKRKAPLSDVLTELFAGQDMEMREMKGQVLLRKKLIPPVKEETTINPIPKQNETIKSPIPVPQSKQPDSVELKTVDKQDSISPKKVPIATLNDSIDSFGSALAEDKISLVAQTSTFIPEWPLKPYEFFTITYLPLNSGSFYLEPRYKVKEQAKPSVWDEMAVLNKKTQGKEKKENGKKENEKRERPEKKFRAGLASYTGYTEFDGTSAILLGGRLIYSPSASLGVGFGGSAFMSRGFYNAELDDNIRLEGGYGGLTFEYALFPQSRVHLNIPITVGAGGFTYVNADNPIGPINPSDSQAFFVLEGGAELEVNVAKFMKLGFGASYRSISGTSLLNRDSQQEVVKASVLEGMSYGIVLKFGWF